MSDRQFVHLHCHSHYSLLDGASSIPKLVERAKQHGMNALALTDHGNLHGALEFYKKAKAGGINPIIGYEAYIAPGSRFHKEAGSMKEASYHLTLLAQNRTGYKNLIKLASKAYLEGFYFKPRIDKEILAEHSEGIICLSGCVSGEFSRAILANHGKAESTWEEATRIAEWFSKTFGDRFFIEIQNNGVEIQRLAMEGAVEVSRKVGIPLVATSDAHYVDKEDAEAQDVMLCINTGKFRSDTNRMKMDGNQYFLRTPAEMYDAFPGYEEAVQRSQEIANTVDIDLKLGTRNFPSYTIPTSQTPEDYLRELCITGLKDRYSDDPEMLKDGQLAQVVLDRLDRELNVINTLGFPNYFLIVWDFVNKARELGIQATARGSGVGALVSFSLYLSHVCPIKYDLLFERFLDIQRTEAPDIDIDFCQERRGEIIRYVKDKYGEEMVAQIGTFGTLQARAAIKDVGRTLGFPLQRVEQITELIPKTLGISIEEALEEAEDLRKLYQSDSEVKELIDLAMKIEGLARNVGTHAAAVVIADKPLTEYVPLCKVTGKTDIITQWSMGDVEAAGLLKMDFLGLRNLTILSKVVDLIEQTTGKRVDPYKFPLDDKQTFELLRRGETKGIFQLESGGIRDLLQKMKPDHFHDIIATNALYRPGPLEGGMVDDYVAVKLGRKQAVYKHPVLEKVLTETHGVMVYQEQVMRILNQLGGIDLAAAYTCIKAISKKKESMIQANREKFIAGAGERGMNSADSNDIWELIVKFAGYGFNKSHSTAYALIAYMTAYLKAHYPVEFMAALLSSDIPGRNFKRKDALVEHMEDCERMNAEVLPPDVNRCFPDFTVKDGKINFGLAAVKGCGGGAGDAIAAARKSGGPFRNLFDFCERVDAASCNRATIETLIKAGAFDAFGKRSQLLAVLDRAIQSGAAQLADRKTGQKNLFASFAEEEKAAPADVKLPDIPELDDRTLLAYEKEVLGYYLNSHPLAEYEEKLSAFCSHTTADVPEIKDRTTIVMGGMIGSIKFAYTKKGDKYANFDLEDVEGMIRCVMWPDDYAKAIEIIKPDAVLVVRGRLERRGGDEANLIVNEVTPIDQLDSKYTKGVTLHLRESDGAAEKLPRVREIVRSYPGECEVKILLSLSDGTRVHLRSTRLRVEITPELGERLKDLLGPGNFKLITAPPKTEGPTPLRGFSREKART